ncbi:MAG: efflux RND transporter permease subunit [Paludibaculum sp.]
MIAIALILAAVFIPTAFIPGITGRLYQQFAVTIAISVIISAFNALSLSPALCALLLKPRSPRPDRWRNSSAGSIAYSDGPRIDISVISGVDDPEVRFQFGLSASSSRC